MTNPDEPAFPINTSDGLTKREYIALTLMEGLLSEHAARYRARPELAAKKAVECTDELLKQLE